MSHTTTSPEVDDLLRAADPLTTPPPSEAETEAALRRLMTTARVTTDRPVHGRATPTRERRSRLGLLMASAAGVTGAIAAALVLVLGAATSSPAFAVTRNTDGTVTVRFLKRADVSPAMMRALNNALASARVRSRFVTTTSGVTVRCPDGRVARSVTLNPTPAVRLTADGSGRPADPAANTAFAKARRAAGMSGAGGDITKSRPAGVSLSWNCSIR